MSRLFHISQDNKSAFRNPWVLGWLGLLVTVVAVNVVFIVTAFRTSPGLVDESYYEQGRDVEKNFQQKLEARNRLGWDIRLNSPEEIVLGRSATYTLNVVDRIGLPLKDAVVTMHAYRPSDAAADIRAEMERINNGIYQTSLNLPLKGIWDLRVKISKGEDELELERRITVVSQ
jgi:nitrogen fixation protein FixH